MYLISGYTLIMLQVLCLKFSRQLTELWTLRRLRSRLHTTVSLLTDFDHLLNSKLPLIVRKMLYTLTVGLGNASRRFSGTLNSKSRQGQSLYQRRRSQQYSRAFLLAAHDHLREKRCYFAAVQAIKSRFFLVMIYRKYLHSLFSSLPLYQLQFSLELPPPYSTIFFCLFVFFSWGCCLQLRNCSVMLLRNCGSVLWFQ